jgi:hypothetical protein
MTGLEPYTNDEIDRKTSRSICDAVGERLQQSLRPQVMDPAPELDRLVEELQRREGGADAPRDGGFQFFR